MPSLEEDLVVVLVGSDARPPYAGARADVIMVAQAPADPSQPVTLVSLPRDMVVDIPCFGSTRINGALNGCDDVSGLELLGVAVEDWTGLSVDHMAAVDFRGFEHVVDAVGGYPVCLDHAVRDADSDLDVEAGCQTLDGADALGWMRARTFERNVDGRWEPAAVSDLVRTDRQRDLLLHVVDRVREMDGVGAVSDLVGSVADAVTIDSGWSIASIVDVALAVRSRTIHAGHVATDPYTDEQGNAVLAPAETYDEARARIIDE